MDTKFKAKKVVDKLLSEGNDRDGSVQSVLDDIEHDFKKLSELVPKTVPTTPEMKRKMSVVKSKLHIILREFSATLELLAEESSEID